MLKEFTVHIFCHTPRLCNLILKKLSEAEYKLDCTQIYSEEKFEIDKLKISPDCIIIDKELSCDLKENIRSKFGNCELIFLPSLDEPDGCDSRSGIQISEPFRMSELFEIINGLYRKKLDEQKI